MEGGALCSTGHVEPPGALLSQYGLAGPEVKNS